ncbi:nitroreductase family protein [Paenibacillus rigui]|uniref:nitroreductase family protein n=1 Tax=Paenibacillus rigui TaxID=554312 RepID=UPI001FE4B79A|nr:nitroreductase [Paenibacillus rigui]
MNQPISLSMGLGEAIRGRRSIGRVKQEPIAKEIIETLLEAAAWAPSHHATEPWRFYVMVGEGRRILAEAYADIAVEHSRGVVAEDEEAALRAKHGSKAFRAPVVIAAAVSPSNAPGVNRMEEFAAVHSAVQNMLLAAHAMGLGAIWRSGEPMYHPRMKQAFGLADAEEVVGLIYLGYPDIQQPHGKREPVAAKTVWLQG